VLAIFLGTFAGGIAGAASPHGIDKVAPVFGFIMGAILGFVLSSIGAGLIFFIAQIERNTRSLLERERFEEPTQYRAAPRF
jgi:hypothetical protein